MNLTDINKVIGALIQKGWVLARNKEESVSDVCAVILKEGNTPTKRFWQVEYIQDVAGDSMKVLYSCSDMQKVIDHVKRDAGIRIAEERLDGFFWYGTTDKGKRIVIRLAHVNNLED